MPAVTLYDIASKEPTESWSLNPWKPRMMMNYKGVDYKTEFIEFQDIAATLKKVGFSPIDKNAPGYYADYTIPAARFEDGTLVMDSLLIAQEIEKRFPSPSLELDNPIVAHVQDNLPKISGPLVPRFLPNIPRNVLGEAAAEYFQRTRKEQFGKPLSQVEEEFNFEQAWDKIKEPAKEYGDLLRKNGGPFFLGEKVSYADCIFVTYLEFLRRVDPKLFEMFLALDTAFGKVYDASKEWLKRAD